MVKLIISIIVLALIIPSLAITNLDGHYTYDGWIDAESATPTIVERLSGTGQGTYDTSVYIGEESDSLNSSAIHNGTALDGRYSLTAKGVQTASLQISRASQMQTSNTVTIGLSGTMGGSLDYRGRDGYSRERVVAAGRYNRPAKYKDVELGGRSFSGEASLDRSRESPKYDTAAEVYAPTGNTTVNNATEDIPLLPENVSNTNSTLPVPLYNTTTGNVTEASPVNVTVTEPVKLNTTPPSYANMTWQEYEQQLEEMKKAAGVS